MSYLLALLLSGLLMTAPGAFATGLFDEAFSARFSLYAHGTMIGRSQWRLSPVEGGLVYQSQSEAAGLAKLLRDVRIVERSEWRSHQGGLRPHHYLYERRGKKLKRVVVAFDWGQGLAHNTVWGRDTSTSLPAGTVDKLGYLLAMMHDLAAGKRSFEYRVAEGAKLSIYRLEASGQERIETRLGTLDTVRVRRVRADSPRETTFWCAGELGYLPVRVEHREKNGEVIRLEIDSLDGLGAGPT